MDLSNEEDLREYVQTESISFDRNEDGRSDHSEGFETAVYNHETGRHLDEFSDFEEEQLPSAGDDAESLFELYLRSNFLTSTQNTLLDLCRHSEKVEEWPHAPMARDALALLLDVHLHLGCPSCRAALNLLPVGMRLIYMCRGCFDAIFRCAAFSTMSPTVHLRTRMHAPIFDNGNGEHWFLESVWNNGVFIALAVIISRVPMEDL